MKPLLIILLLLTCSQNGIGQAPEELSLLGLTAKVALPTADFKNSAGHGFAVGFISQSKLVEDIYVTAEGAFYRFGGKSISMDSLNQKRESVNFTGFQVGLRYFWQKYFFAIDGGYFFNDDQIGEWGLCSSIGIQLSRYDILLGLKTLNDINFISLRIGWYFIEL